MKKLSLFLAVLLSLFLAGCPEENPDLVNPEPVTQLTRLRVLNLSRAEAPVNVRIDGELLIEDIAYGEITELQQPPDVPPYDSLRFEVLSSSGELLFEPARRPRLFRNIDYTYILLPSTKEDTIQADIRRLITSQTTPSVPVNNPNAYLKLVSGVDKDGFGISLREGCQSGEQLLLSSSLGLVTAARELAPGERVISLVATREGMAPETIGTFELSLETQKQYLILVMEEGDGYKVLLLDEEDETSTLTPLETVENQELSIRVANVTGEVLNIGVNSDLTAFPDVQSQYMTEYSIFGACQSVNPDTFRIASTGDPISTVTEQLNVGDNYTMLVYGDFADGLKWKFVRPIPLSYQKKDQHSTVRVINLIEDKTGVTLSVASNSEQVKNAPAGLLSEPIINRNFVSGSALAASLRYGELSAPTETVHGRLPITLFTSAQPAQLLGAYIYEFLPDEDYICIIHGSEEEPKLSIISDNSPGGTIEALEEGAVVQVVNAKSSEEPVGLSISSSQGYAPLTQAKLVYTNSVATVVPVGNVETTVDGGVQNNMAESAKRLLIIATGNGNIALNDPKMSFEGRNFAYRLIHAAPDAPPILIKKDPEGGPVFEKVGFGEASAPFIDPIEANYAFYIYDADADKLIATAQDIALNYYKRYYLIFAGEGAERDPDDNSYSLIVAQEF